MNGNFLIEKVRDEVIIQLKPIKGKTAADIGAETGFMSEGLINAELKVIAIDSAPEAVAFLKDKFRDITEFEAELSSPAIINLGDESVDYAFAYMYLQRTINPEEQVREIFRILKHGGQAAVIDILNRDHEDPDHTMFSGFLFPDIYAWFINTGFKNISIEKSDHSITYSDPAGTEVIADIFIASGEK